MADKISTTDAQNTLKEISKELISLESTSIISLFEIDLRTIKENLNIGGAAISPDILRFHNLEAFNQRTINFRGDTYHPMPIMADGFEVSSNGSLPRPTLTMTPLKQILDSADNDITVSSREYFISLKRAILELDNMIGAKVTRIRTFFKFLDATNSYEGVGDFTSGLNKNPEFPRETYYVERKMTEDKNMLQFELSSVLDLENFKLPGRLCIANRCPWTYRGEGCCYEFKDLGTTEGHGATENLPTFAPPVANDEDALITGIATGSNGQTVYSPTSWTAANVFNYIEEGLSKVYSAGNVVYIEKDGIKYYYVAKVSVPVGNPPPHTDYWVADRCSKTLDGCKLRWGNAGYAKQTGGTAANSFLPFGGFPGTNTKTSVR